MKNPTTSEIRQARESAGLSQTEAARLVHSALRTWQQWEAEPGSASHRKMHPAFWELFELKIAKRILKLKERLSGKTCGNRANEQHPENG